MIKNFFEQYSFRAWFLVAGVVLLGVSYGASLLFGTKCFTGYINPLQQCGDIKDILFILGELLGWIFIIFGLTFLLGKSISARNKLVVIFAFFALLLTVILMFYYAYLSERPISISAIPSRGEVETANWQTYRNEEYGLR